MLRIALGCEPESQDCTWMSVFQHLEQLLSLDFPEAPCAQLGLNNAVGAII